MDLKPRKQQRTPKHQEKQRYEILPHYSFAEHYAELRSAILWSVAAYILGTVVAYYYAANIYHLLSQPLLEALEQNQTAGRRFIYTGISEAFFTYMNLAFYFGFVLSFPVIAYKIYSFLAPALYKKERRLMMPYLFLAPVLFGLGAFFAYFVVMPITWRFFLSFEHIGIVAKNIIPIMLEARVSEYFASVLHLIVAFGVAFQTPLVVILLFDAGIIAITTLSSIRKYVIVGAFVVAAILTPPDVLSQISLAIPLVLLYEVAIVICKIKNPKTAIKSKK